MKRHVGSKNGIQKLELSGGPVCDDRGKVFANWRNLEKHLKTNLKCNTCKKEFSSAEEAKKHQKEHTTCEYCQKDFYFISKLTKHVSAMHK